MRDDINSFLVIQTDLCPPGLGRAARPMAILWRRRRGWPDHRSWGGHWPGQTRAQAPVTAVTLCSYSLSLSPLSVSSCPPTFRPVTWATTRSTRSHFLDFSPCWYLAAGTVAEKLGQTYHLTSLSRESCLENLFARLFRCDADMCQGRKVWSGREEKIQFVHHLPVLEPPEDCFCQ